MGTSVCTYHIRERTREAGLNALAVADSPRAYVSPVTDHWLSVVDEDSERFRVEELESTVAKVSKHLDSDVLLVGVYDDDISFYVAFHAGAIVDRFSTSPDAFDWFKPRQKFRGNPKRLSQTYTWWHGWERLESALKKRLFLEGLRYNQIAQAFGIASQRANTTFGDIAEPISPYLLRSRKPGSPLDLSIRDQESYVEFKGKRPP